METRSADRVSVCLTSDIVYDYTCTACSEDGENSEATHFCPQCAKFFCHSCVVHHNKILRSHSLLGKKDQSQWGSTKILSGLELCKNHVGKELELFCSDHDKLCCAICVSVEHRNCKMIQHIPDIATGIRESADFKRLQQTMNEHLKNLNSSFKGKNKDAQALKEHYQQLQRSIKHFRDKLNKMLDELEKKTSTRLDEIYAKLDGKLGENIRKVKIICDEVQSMLITMKDDAKYTETSAFIAYKKCQDKLTDTDSLLDEMNKKEYAINFKGNTEIEKYFSSLVAFGEFHSGLADTDGQHVDAYKVWGRKEHKISVKSDRKANEIWGCCQLPDGTFVLTDSSNQKVKVLNDQLNLQSSMDISPMFPNDVCHISDLEVAVSTGGNNRREIWFINTKFGQLTLTERRKLDHLCGGIAYKMGCLYVSSNTALYVYTQAGKLLNKLYEDTAGSNTIFNFALSHDGKRIYITNMDKHQLITLDSHGNKLATFTDQKLKRPTGICVAANSTVFVCGYDTATVMQVDGNGKNKLAFMATYSEGIYAPYSLTFVSNPPRLIVGQVKESILVFNLI